MKRFLALPAFLLIIIALSACSTGQLGHGGQSREQEKLVDHQYLKINLEKSGGVTNQNFQHPTKIDPILIETILSDLFYPVDPGFLNKSKEQPVFKPEEIERLAPALSSALLKAGADERVRFVSFNKGGGLIFEDERRTEGIAFIDGNDRFNIAFSTLNESIEVEDTSSRISMPETRDPMEIKKAYTRIIPKGTYMQNHRIDGGADYPLWITADLESLENEISRAADAAEKSITDGDVSDLPGGNELKTKLRYLKELYEEDLITETEYQEQKKEILEQIK